MALDRNLYLCEPLVIRQWRLHKYFRCNRGRQNLTYHVSLLVDHHPKVFKYVVDVHNVRLDHADAETDWLEVCLSENAELLSLHGRTSSCLMADSLSWICCRSSSVMTSAWDCIWESLQEWDQGQIILNKSICTTVKQSDDPTVVMTVRRWTHPIKEGTCPKLSSGCPPCWETMRDHFAVKWWQNVSVWLGTCDWSLCGGYEALRHEEGEHLVFCEAS